MSLPIEWGGSDLFTHMLAVGPTRCGKTATILKPIIYQMLLQKKRGIPLGISVVEPKGDVAEMVYEMCLEMDIPCIHIDPMKDETDKFNPMEGEINDVAEATVIVLKGLFGKQDAFFATVQELSARNVTKLLKELYGDNMDIVDVMNTLRDQTVLESKVAELKQRDGMTDLVHFFESELLGSMREKYQQFVIGLRAQLENVVSNDALRKIMTGKSSIDIDQHFEEGGVLAVNTALGKLRSSGDAFGQFVIMHLQNGTFRRPGTEDTRIPHFLIVDEYSRYINPDVEIFLNLAAEYRVAGIFATQSLGQLELESGKVSARAMKRAIMGGCRNKIVFGGIGAEDAKDFAEELGKDKIIMRQSTYKNRIFLPNLFPDSFRDTEDEEYRFDPTDLMDGLPRFNFVHKLLQDGTPQKPALGQGTFVPRDWKERREWEDGVTLNVDNKKEKKQSMFSSLLNQFSRKDKVKSVGINEVEADETDFVVPSEDTHPIVAESNYTKLNMDDEKVTVEAKVDEVPPLIKSKPNQNEVESAKQVSKSDQVNHSIEYQQVHDYSKYEPEYEQEKVSPSVSTKEQEAEFKPNTEKEKVAESPKVRAQVKFSSKEDDFWN